MQSNLNAWTRCDVLAQMMCTCCVGDGADDEDDEQCQESFFSSTGHADPQWFCLSAASNHFQSADSLSTSGTPSCSTTTGEQGNHT